MFRDPAIAFPRKYMYIVQWSIWLNPDVEIVKNKRNQASSFWKIAFNFGYMVVIFHIRK